MKRNTMDKPVQNPKPVLMTGKNGEKSNGSNGSSRPPQKRRPQAARDL